MKREGKKEGGKKRSREREKKRGEKREREQNKRPETKKKKKTTHVLAKRRVGARHERAAIQLARERRLASHHVRLGLAVVELVAAARGAPRDVLSADGSHGHERQRLGFGGLRVLAAAAEALRSLAVRRTPCWVTVRRRR